MKKILILVLMALMAAGAFAQSVEFHGLVEYETASSLSGPKDNNQFANYGRYDGDVRLWADIKPDDYNTGRIRVRSRTNDTAGGVMIDNAWVTTDIGKFFGLPIGWKSSIGLNEWAWAPVGNLKWDTLHRVIQRPVTYSGSGVGSGGNWADYFFDRKIWGIKESFVFADVVTFNAWFSLEGNGASKTGADLDGYSASTGNIGNGGSEGLTGVANQYDAEYSKLRDYYLDLVFSQKGLGPGTFAFEIAHMVNTTYGSRLARKYKADKELGIADGTYMFALGYTETPVAPDVTVDFGAAFYLGGSKASWSGYAVNAGVNVGKLAYAVVGLQGYLDGKGDADTGLSTWKVADKYSNAGYKGDILHNVRVGLGATPVEFLSIDLGFLFYLGNDKFIEYGGTSLDPKKRSVLNTIDVSAALKVGKGLEYRIGYLYVPKNDISIDPFNGGDNNLEVIAKALYFKGKLAF